MKFIIVFSAFLAIVICKPSGQLLTAPATIVLGTPIQQQYHAQDALGQYSYGYSDGLSVKQESKSFDGITRGGYSYIDANGKLQSVAYTADALNGFRVAATNLPKALPAPEPIQQILPLPVSDTPEVTAAREAHLRTLEEVKIRNTNAASESILLNQLQDLPKPVEDTPEVAKAKAEHFAAIKEAELRNAALELRVIQEQSAIAQIPIPIARLQPIIPSQHIIVQQPAYKSIQLPNGFSYSYGYANTPFAWDSRFLIASPQIAY